MTDELGPGMEPGSVPRQSLVAGAIGSWPSARIVRTGQSGRWPNTSDSGARTEGSLSGCGASFMRAAFGGTPWAIVKTDQVVSRKCDYRPSTLRAKLGYEHAHQEASHESARVSGRFGSRVSRRVSTRTHLPWIVRHTAAAGGSSKVLHIAHYGRPTPALDAASRVASIQDGPGEPAGAGFKGSAERGGRKSPI